jgi:hypothetical protein
MRPTNCAEDTAYPAAPDSEYGWEKLLAERLFLNYGCCHGLEPRIARYHNVFGPEGEPHAARSQSSGPFTEAAALGKPVVVPAGTWMSEQLAAGHAAGTIFAKPTAESVADSVIEALQGLDSFAAAAERIAPVIRKENSCQRVLERMLELATRITRYGAALPPWRGH